jgi:hypothetical protein
MDTSAASMDTGSAAAVTAASAATMASAATAMASAATAMAASAAAAAGQFYLLGERGLSGVFLVKDIKLRQADVEDLLLTEKDFVTLTL